MLWLASLLGIVAVGSVGMVDFSNTTEEENDDAVDTDVTGPTQELPEASVSSTNGSDDNDTLVGTDGTDSIFAAGGDDEIGGMDGDDSLFGAAGDDALFGMDGNDMLVGGEGHDTLNGNDGADILLGDAGDDVLVGHNSDDTLLGGSGNDALQGSAGDDVLDGQSGSDALQGGLGDDKLTGGQGTDTLFGGWGDDTLSGVDTDPANDDSLDTDAGDFLNGGGGDDVIIAGNNDVASGGEGADTFVLGNWFEKGQSALISDFDSESDSLLLVFEDGGMDTPDVSLEPDPNNDEITHVLFDGIAVAQVHGSQFDIEDIALMPLSVAQVAGFAPV